MPSILRSRFQQTLNSKLDGSIDITRYVLQPSGSYVPVLVASRDLLGYDKGQHTNDFNNRRNSDIHVLPDRNKGYIGGFPFSTSSVEIYSPTQVIPELCSIDGNLDSAYTWKGKVTSGFQVPFTEDIWTDDDGNFHDPYSWDGFGFISQYTSKARVDLRPDLPKFDLLQELVELRDIPRLIRDTREALSNLIGLLSSPRKLSGAYLSYQFGYLPIIRSVKDFMSLYNNVNKYIQQLIRDDGKRIHRRRDYVRPSKSKISWKRTIPDFRMIPVVEGLDAYPFPEGSNNSTDVFITETTACWATGTYEYWLPPGPRDLKWATKLARKLAGLEPSPSQLYNLVPWSWLVDWFIDVGTWIRSHDPSIADNGAFSDFYMMGNRHIKVETVSRTTVRDKSSGDPVELVFTQRTDYRNKLRVPYGPFDTPWIGNFDFTQMSDYQKSILAALAIQRFPRVLDRMRGSL